jgi:hypothetical protein
MPNQSGEAVLGDGLFRSLSCQGLPFPLLVGYKSRLLEVAELPIFNN